MSNETNLVDKIKSKDLLWYASILVMLLGFFGIGYGIWVTYNGVLLKDMNSGPAITTLDSLGMSVQDGVYSFIIFGSTLIIYYGLVLGSGIIGLVSSNHLLIKRKLLWFTLFLLIILIVIWIMGIVGLIAGIITLVLLLFLGFATIRKYNIDYPIYRKQQRSSK